MKGTGHTAWLLLIKCLALTFFLHLFHWKGICVELESLEIQAWGPTNNLSSARPEIMSFHWWCFAQYVKSSLYVLRNSYLVNLGSYTFTNLKNSESLANTLLSYLPVSVFHSSPLSDPWVLSTPLTYNIWADNMVIQLSSWAIFMPL